MCAVPCGRSLRAASDNEWIPLTGQQGVYTVYRLSHEPRPLAVALLFFTWLDGEGLAFQRLAGRALVNGLEPEDVAVIGSMSDDIALSPHVTSDKSRLYRILDEELWPGPMNGVGAVSDMAMETFSHAGETRKRAIVFIGQDHGDRCPSGWLGPKGAAVHSGDEGIWTFTGNLLPRLWPAGTVAYRCVSAEQATTRAQSDAVVVYGLPLPVPFGVNPRRPVMRMSRETGGGYAELRDGDDLEATMARVLDGLRRDYLIGFTPPLRDGREHRIEVRVDRPGMTTYARRTFRLGDGP